MSFLYMLIDCGYQDPHWRYVYDPDTGAECQELGLNLGLSGTNITDLMTRPGGSKSYTRREGAGFGRKAYWRVLNPVVAATSNHDKEIQKAGFLGERA